MGFKSQSELHSFHYGPLSTHPLGMSPQTLERSQIRQPQTQTNGLFLPLGLSVGGRTAPGWLSLNRNTVLQLNLDCRCLLVNCLKFFMPRPSFNSHNTPALVLSPGPPTLLFHQAPSSPPSRITPVDAPLRPPLESATQFPFRSG